MPTVYTDQFWVMDPFSPPPVGTLLTVSNFEIIDQNDNDLINRFSGDSVDGSDITASYPGDTVTVTLGDGTTITVTGVTFYLADGRQVFTPTDGTILADATLVSTTFVTTQASVPPDVLTPVCFTADTLITTANGWARVQDLTAGDVILSADKGLVRVCLIHERTLSVAHLRKNPAHCPVVLAAGSMGQGLPARDLIVSPQHRILIRSDVAQRMFGENEILVPAVQLVGQPGISRRINKDPVRYVHILLDHHGVIFAENSPCESLYLGEQTHENLPEREMCLIRSKLQTQGPLRMQPARLFVRGRRLKRLLERHSNNRKPLLDRRLSSDNKRLHLTG